MQEVAGEEVRFYKERHDATIKDNMSFRRKVLSAVGFLSGIPVGRPVGSVVVGAVGATLGYLFGGDFWE